MRGTQEGLKRTRRTVVVDVAERRAGRRSVVEARLDGMELCLRRTPSKRALVSEVSSEQ